MPALTKINLASLAKQKGNKRQAITFRPIEPTKTKANELGAIYMAVVRNWRNVIAETILPAYSAALERLTTDDATGTLTSAIDLGEGQNFRVVAEAHTKTRTWTVQLEKWHLSQWAKAIAGGTGLQVGGVLLNEDASDQIAIALQRNAGLIRNLGEDMQKRVEQTVWQGVANQTPRRQIARQLSEALDIGRTRALNIAVDQTNKLGGELDRMRQQQAGIEEYKWRHSGKVHFRPEHKARDGQIFRWDDPPKDGPPRTLPFCGCTAQAHLSLEEES
jgi:SPP1 gp7 family putative phage head morphogenesis protein